MDKGRIIELHNQGWGRVRISKETGISERKIRGVIAEYKQSDRVVQSYRNGIHFIERTIELAEGELLGPDAIMDACKVDRDKFELITFNLSEWEGGKNGSIKYAVKVQLRPRRTGFDFDAVIEKIAVIEPRVIEPKSGPKSGLLEIPVTDAHFGINSFKDYNSVRERIVNLIDNRERIVLMMGSDNLHVNGFDNQTVKGTQLEEVDVERAWEQAFLFYADIIENGLKYAGAVDVIYLPGNHDRDLSWALAKALERMYPQAEFDINMEQYKAFRYGRVAIGWTHGDKGKPADFDRVFPAMFPDVFEGAVTREIHYGHVHHEKVLDTYGTMVRALPTGTIANKYTVDNGYISERRFQCFEYDGDNLRAIHYV